MTVCGVCTHKLDVTLASFTRADGSPPLTATKLVRIILSLKLLHTLNSPVELKGEPNGEPRHSALCSHRGGGSEEPALVMESRLIRVSNMKLHVITGFLTWSSRCSELQSSYLIKTAASFCTKGLSHMNQKTSTAVMTHMFAAGLHMKQPGTERKLEKKRLCTAAAEKANF